MITATISLEDHLAAQRLHARQSSKRVMVFLAVLLLVGVVVLQLSDANEIIGQVLIGSGGGGLIGLALLHVWGRRGCCGWTGAARYPHAPHEMPPAAATASRWRRCRPRPR